MTSSKSNESTIHIALLIIGEIGKNYDLSKHQGIDKNIVGLFEHKDESIRAAAAYALGNIAVGNMDKFLPVLLDLIKSKPTHSYIVFSALKEIIATHSTNEKTRQAFVPYVARVTEPLWANAEAKDEAVRSIVAECLGRIIAIQPTQLSDLAKLPQSKSSQSREVAIIALRFAVSPHMDYVKFSNTLPSFLSLITDPDLEVRRQCLLTVNALARTNIELIQKETLTKVVLPALYVETKVKPELVREVDYGAFKKTIDDGKPLRKACFQCLDTLLDVSAHRLDMQQFIGYVKQGLTDFDDIQISTFQTFEHIASYHGSALLETLDQLPEIIMKSVKAHIAASKLPQPESALECLRSIVRAMLRFNRIPGVELCTAYTHFFKQVCATPLLAGMVKELEASR